MIRPRLFGLAAGTLFSLTLIFSLGAFGFSIPDFTPNIVDPAKALSASEMQEINQDFQSLRDRSDIRPAVYLVPSLEGHSIEQVAHDAFVQWKLGAKGVNNGLLLVIAINGHRSRFEIGYGLEGALPDAIAHRALERAFNPRMREGQTKQAILDAFHFMENARLRTEAGPAAEIRDPSQTTRFISAGLNVVVCLLVFGLGQLLFQTRRKRFWVRIAEENHLDLALVALDFTEPYLKTGGIWFALMIVVGLLSPLIGMIGPIAVVGTAVVALVLTKKRLTALAAGFANEKLEQALDRAEKRSLLSNFIASNPLTYHETAFLTQDSNCVWRYHTTKDTFALPEDERLFAYKGPLGFENFFGGISPFTYSYSVTSSSIAAGTFSNSSSSDQSPSWSSSDSSSSSSSSFDSSSGGGDSGGGGASSSW